MIADGPSNRSENSQTLTAERQFEAELEKPCEVEVVNVSEKDTAKGNSSKA